MTREEILKIRKEHKKDNKCELYNDHFENAKRYGIPHAQLIIADIPYNLGNNAYASNPQWYKDGDIDTAHILQSRGIAPAFCTK